MYSMDMVLSQRSGENWLQEDKRRKFKQRAVVPYISLMRMSVLMERDSKLGPDWTERIQFPIWLYRLHSTPSVILQAHLQQQQLDLQQIRSTGNSPTIQNAVSISPQSITGLACVRFVPYSDPTKCGSFCFVKSHHNRARARIWPR